MVQFTKHRQSIGRFIPRTGSPEDINEEIADDTPWITVENGSFVRDVLLAGAIAGVIISVVVVLLTKLLPLTGLFEFESILQTGDLAAALSVVAFLGVGYAGYMNSKRTAKRAHTVVLLSEILSNDALFESLMTVRCMEDDAIDTYAKADSFPPANGHEVIRVLSFYEFLACACNSHDADANVVLKVHGGGISQTARNFEPVIKRTRKEYGSEKFKAFERLGAKYDDINPTYDDKIEERSTDCSVGRPRSERPCHYSLVGSRVYSPTAR